MGRQADAFIALPGLFVFIILFQSMYFVKNKKDVYI